jgi:hypothetical protein
MIVVLSQKYEKLDENSVLKIELSPETLVYYQLCAIYHKCSVETILKSTLERNAKECTKEIEEIFG